LRGLVLSYDYSWKFFLLSRCLLDVVLMAFTLWFGLRFIRSIAVILYLPLVSAENREKRRHGLDDIMARLI
jgi:hypothetical protein